MVLTPEVSQQHHNVDVKGCCNLVEDRHVLVRFLYIRLAFKEKKLEANAKHQKQLQLNFWIFSDKNKYQVCDSPTHENE